MNFMLTNARDPVATGRGQSGAYFDGAGFTRWHASHEHTHFRNHFLRLWPLTYF